jgi:DNA-binding helix-hairpin-helix protein with protein kinase domain
MIRGRFLVAAALVAVLGAAGTFAVSRAGQGQAAPTQADEIRELRQRVERLEARVQVLERQVPRVVVPSEGPPQLRIAPQGPLQGRPLPKNWIPREFNGQRYYDIPLDSASPRK